MYLAGMTDIGTFPRVANSVRTMSSTALTDLRNDYVSKKTISCRMYIFRQTYQVISNGYLLIIFCVPKVDCGKPTRFYILKNSSSIF